MTMTDTNSNKYDTILFDLDGTLLDTSIDLYLSTNYALSKFGYPNRTLEEVKHFLGNGVKVLINKALPEEAKDKTDKVLDVFKEHYKIHSMDHVVLYDGIIELLEELKKKKIKVGIVTNKFHQAALDIYNKYFKDYADMILGEQPNMPKKPDKAMCEYILRLMNKEAKGTLYIGDSEVDILTARNSNLDCISCSWGFRNKQELLSSNATIIIDKPMDLLNFI